MPRSREKDKNCNIIILMYKISLEFLISTYQMVTLLHYIIQSKTTCPTHFAFSWIYHKSFERSIHGWLVVLRIYIASEVFQPYRDLEAGDNQSLKFKWRDRESNPGPLAPLAKSLTTRPPPLPGGVFTEM